MKWFHELVVVQRIGGIADARFGDVISRIDEALLFHDLEMSIHELVSHYFGSW